MHTRYLIAVIASACTTTRAAEIPPVAGAEVAGTFLHLAPDGVAGASDISLSYAIRTSCGGVCDRVYLAVDDGTSPELLARVSAAAATASPPPRVFVVPPDDSRVELATDLQGECLVEVGVLDTGAYVLREGKPLPSDTTCARWDTAICRAEDLRYDWPRLRSVAGDQEVVCLAFGTATVAELSAIHEALRRPVFRVVSVRGQAETLQATELADAIRGAGADLQWCLDGEVAEEPAPMQATLRFAVGPDGRVTRAAVVAGIRTTAQFEECLSTAAQTKVTFEARPNAAVGEITLAFEPGAKRPRVVEP